jgi:hypothetical protein
VPHLPTDTNPLDYAHVAKDKDWFHESTDFYIFALFSSVMDSITNPKLNDLIIIVIVLLYNFNQKKACKSYLYRFAGPVINLNFSTN